ncbi:hypothetical protein WMY93_023096 [Mugilogobius chulae]|uniref:Gypsy retrotransposon integrase-like protein 1 n=1 Tax=Mugilogobius chulae TaxID=88201 RepID=A0AAW0N3D0_9GOBI
MMDEISTQLGTISGENEEEDYDYKNEDVDDEEQDKTPADKSNTDTVPSQSRPVSLPSQHAGSLSYDQPAPTQANPAVNMGPRISLSASDLNPPEIQRVVVEHIVRKDDFNIQSMSALRLRTFSGKVLKPQHEADYDSWRSHIDLLSADPSLSQLHITRRIIESLLPPAADLVKSLGPDTLPSMFLSVLDSAYATVEDGEELFAQFLNTLQNQEFIGEPTAIDTLALVVPDLKTSQPPVLIGTNTLDVLYEKYWQTHEAGFHPVPFGYRAVLKILDIRRRLAADDHHAVLRAQSTMPQTILAGQTVSCLVDLPPAQPFHLPVVITNESDHDVVIPARATIAEISAIHSILHKEQSASELSNSTESNQTKLNYNFGDSELSPEWKQRVTAMLDSIPEVFAKHELDFGCTTKSNMKSSCPTKLHSNSDHARSIRKTSMLSSDKDQVVALVQALSLDTDSLPDSFVNDEQFSSPVVPSLSAVEIAAKQRADPVIQHVIAQLETGETPPPTAKDQLPDLPLLLRELTRLELQNNVLVRRRNVGDELTYQLVLPEECRSEVLIQLHDQMGHLGTERTLDLVRTRFYWPRMSVDITNKIKTCERCVKRKAQPERAAPLVNIKTTRPLELVCMDFLSIEPDRRTRIPSNVPVNRSLPRKLMQHPEQKITLTTAQDRAQTLETSVTELTTQLADSREKVSQLDSQLKAKTELLLSTEAAKSSQKANLENSLETAQHALQDKQQELAKLQKKAEEQVSEAQRGKEQCIQLETTKLESRSARWRLLETRLIKKWQKIQKEGSEVKKKAKELHQLLEKEKAGAVTLQEELQKKTSALGEVQLQLERSEQEKGALKQNLDKTTQEAKTQRGEQEKKLQSLNADLLKAQQERDAHKKELLSLQENMGKTSKALKDVQSQLDTDRKNHKAAIDEKDKNSEKTKQELMKANEALSKTLKEAKEQLQKTKEEENKLKEQLSSLQEQCTKTVEGLKDREKSIQKLQTQFKAAQGTFDEELKKMKGQVAKLQEVNVQKGEEEKKLQIQVSGLEQSLSSEKSRFAELQSSLQKNQDSLKKLQSDLYGKESEASALRQDLKASEDKLKLAQEELAANQTHQTSLEAQIQELKSGSKSLEQELAKREQKIHQQEEALKEHNKQTAQTKAELEKLKNQVDELSKAKGALEKSNGKLSTDLKTLKEKTDKELVDLQEAKQLLIQQKLELQGKVEAAEGALQQEQKQHQLTRDGKSKKEEALLTQTKALQEQVTAEKRAKEEQVKRGEEAEAKLSIQVTALNENVATLKRECQGSQRRVSELEKQTDELRGEIAVLEATVQNNQDERRALLERCVKGEGEIEKLQSKVVELRRKLDDTTAAMQELGRENQSLQIKQSQSLTRKWADDNEVQNCMTCGKGFSVTIRKHHCRHCGNIFCAECSSRNALTPSSKKPVRVCETCYEELAG